MILDLAQDAPASVTAEKVALEKFERRKPAITPPRTISAVFRISVLVTAYRRPHQLEEALASLAMQDQSLIGEIIVSDDSPADEAKANQAVIAASELRSLIRYFHHSPSLGCYPNHWFLARQARYAHIMFLHDDDALCAGAISQLVAACKQEIDPNIRLWFGRNIIMDSVGKVDVIDSDAHNVWYGRGHTGSVRQMWEWCLHESIPPNSFLVGTDDYRKLMEGSRDGNVGDFGFVVRLANDGASARFIAQDMSYYRVQAASSTSSGRGVDVHRRFEISTSLRVPPEFESLKRKRFNLMAMTATVRHVRDGERREAWNLYRSDAWSWRKRLSPRGLAVLAMLLTPRLAWNWALGNAA
ncbi:glycosyltransferase family 2 protein [Variovorax sp. RHLX14]|uniref:glycosyltransferase family 2 protein n=1 Tax=Variovorax sp. RHLX14 TaxID=1259731 RepID=UPI003F465B6E